MDKHIIFRPDDVCAKQIEFDLVNGYVHNVNFTNGCRGNTQGVAILVEGMKADEVIARLKGINCHHGNSCPHQLALAIEDSMA